MVVKLGKGTMMIASALAVLALTVLPGAQAQTTNAQCFSGYDYLFNSRDQSPCLVAAYAGGACADGVFNVAAIPIGSYYLGPSVTTICQCSSIFYSLVSACSLCQDGDFLRWSQWITNCSHTYLSVFPVQIPSGTAFPAWAYLDVATTDDFSPADAQYYQFSPESSASVPQATRSLGITQPTQNVSASTDSSNNRALLGGAIGGSLTLIGLLIRLLFYMKSKRDNKRSKLTEEKDTQKVISGGGGDVEQQQHGGGKQQHTEEYSTPQLLATGSVLSTAPSQKFFDPKETATFSIGEQQQYGGRQQQHAGEYSATQSSVPVSGNTSPTVPSQKLLDPKETAKFSVGEQHLYGGHPQQPKYVAEQQHRGEYSAPQSPVSGSTSPTVPSQKLFDTKDAATYPIGEWQQYGDQQHQHTGEYSASQSPVSGSTSPNGPSQRHFDSKDPSSFPMTAPPDYDSIQHSAL